MLREPSVVPPQLVGKSQHPSDLVAPLLAKQGLFAQQGGRGVEEAGGRLDQRGGPLVRHATGHEAVDVGGAGELRGLWSGASLGARSAVAARPTASRHGSDASAGVAGVAAPTEAASAASAQQPSAPAGTTGLRQGAEVAIAAASRHRQRGGRPQRRPKRWGRRRRGG